MAIDFGLPISDFGFFNILKWLPIATRARSQRVCKAWESTIKSHWTILMNSNINSCEKISNFMYTSMDDSFGYINVLLEIAKVATCVNQENAKKYLTQANKLATENLLPNVDQFGQKHVVDILAKTVKTTALTDKELAKQFLESIQSNLSTVNTHWRPAQKAYAQLKFAMLECELNLENAQEKVSNAKANLHQILSGEKNTIILQKSFFIAPDRFLELVWLEIESESESDIKHSLRLLENKACEGTKSDLEKILNGLMCYVNVFLASTDEKENNAASLFLQSYKALTIEVWHIDTASLTTIDEIEAAKKEALKSPIELLQFDNLVNLAMRAAQLGHLEKAIDLLSQARVHLEKMNSTDKKDSEPFLQIGHVFVKQEEARLQPNVEKARETLKNASELLALMLTNSQNHPALPKTIVLFIRQLLRT